MFVVAYFFTTFTHAQDFKPEQGILVLPTTAPGAPSADDIVTYYYTPPGKRSATPPLQALAVASPAIANYLLPVRAQGDQLSRLNANPASPRAKLERYIVVWYPIGTDRSIPLAALQADPYVAAAWLVADGQFSGVELSDFDVIGSGESPSGTELGQYGRADMAVDAAWSVAGGYALVQNIDTGLQENHPAIVQFQGTQYKGGNFISAASLDTSTTADPTSPIVSSASVDERRAMPLSSCNGQPAQLTQPNTAGHGTHTSGLIAANGDAGLGVKGVCRHCGIAMWKSAFVVCATLLGETSPQPLLTANTNAWIGGLGRSGDIGAQVVNMSWVLSDSNPYSQPCSYYPEHGLEDPPMCLSIAVAVEHDVAMVAASGNERNNIRFPARDPHVISAGGYQPGGALWDEAPSGNEANCPLYPYNHNYHQAECGSNYSFYTAPDSPKQELVTSSKSVLSTTYDHYNWSPVLKCGDQFQFSGTIWGSGTGLCTGTSMSAPQIAGLLGLIRSINPLVRFGDDPTTPGTLRSVLTSTASRAGLGWDAKLGYGIPNAEAAARKMLGSVAARPARNRATPLFRLHSADAIGGVGDYADTTSPQLALALMLNAKTAWVPSGTSAASVPNYAHFPHGADEGTAANATPLAPVYVLTTEVRPRNEWPALVPLYLMSVGGDFMLVASKADVEDAHNHASPKYELLTIQGYIYAPCPMDACKPPGALPFYRGCTATGDCATFLSTEAGSFSAYTRKFPWSANNTRELLGYAYPAGDADSDGLPDAFEYAAGTDRNYRDSDRDGINDVVEMPMIGVPTGDPCAGSTGTGSQYCGADVLFKYGFDW